MHRRTILKAAAFGLIAPASVGAAPALPKKEGPEIPSPYDIIQPPVAEDAKIIRLLFAYECSFCRQYHNSIMQWGKTLPQSLKFKSTPILNSTEDTALLAIFGRKIIESIAPENIERYDFLMFERIQDNAAALDSKEILKAIVQTGVDPQKIKHMVDKDKINSIQMQVPEHAGLIEKFGLTATPTVSIAGKMRVTPDHTQGDPQKFSMLLNGLISKLIEGGKNA